MSDTNCSKSIRFGSKQSTATPNTVKRERNVRYFQTLFYKDFCEQSQLSESSIKCLKCICTAKEN